MENKNGENSGQKTVKKFSLKILDIYIIKKFLGTFFFSIIIILSIAVIFDLSEKIDNFIENGAPLKEIVFDYYMNFIPYFGVLFSSLFTFISVIYFTSKMAYNTEIIAILSSGVSFRRLMVPYFISSIFIALITFLLSNYVIPRDTKVKLDFEDKYIQTKPANYNRINIHKQIQPGIFVYMERYSTISQIGTKFSMEKFVDGKLVSKLMADQITWDTTKNDWIIRRYYIRTINGMHESITEGETLDTTLNMTPSDFNRRLNAVEAMTASQLNEFIRVSRMQGEENLTSYLIEKYKRVAFPFSTIILTIIGVAVSSQKVRGGIGMQLGIGLMVSFGYLLFMQFSSQFSIGGTLPPFIAVWLPNIIFGFIAYILYRLAPK